jgi:hypothetical protein
MAAVRSNSAGAPPGQHHRVARALASARLTATADAAARAGRG